MEHERDSDTNCNWYAQNRPQRLSKGSGRVGNRRMNRDHPNYSITKISHNTEDLRRLAVTQTPVKNHQLTYSGQS